MTETPDIPDQRGSTTGREKLTCYKCGSDFYFGGDAERTRCTSCDKNIQVWRSRIASYGDTQFIRELAEAPKTTRELESEPTQKIRDVVQILRPPGNSGKGKGYTVYFLPGDERRAVDRFCEANFDYVQQCLSEERNNQLAQNWPDALYQMLVEQWHWAGHDRLESDSQ